jgi:hypothetical protein
MAQLEDAVRTWWQTVGPADNLPPQFGQLVDPTGPADGQRWPSDSFLTLQVELLWALERAERTFAEGTDLPTAIRAWLTTEKDKRFACLHNRPQRAPDEEGKFARYVSLWPPVDASPKPPREGTYLPLQDDAAILPDLRHLQPEEIREMESVLRSFWRTHARAPFGDDWFLGPPPIEVQTRGFQAQELAGRVSRWEKREGQLGQDRTLVERAIRMRDDLWQLALTDYGLEPPKPRTELVTKQGNTVYVVKWTPELTRPQSAPPAQPRPAPTPEAGAERPSGDVEAGPQVIYTREPSPTLGPLGRPPPSTTLGWQSTGPQLEEAAREGGPRSRRTRDGVATGQDAGPATQAEGAAEGQGRAEEPTPRAAPGLEAGHAPGAQGTDAPSPTPAPAAGHVTVSQVLNESLAQATQQLTTALPNWANTANGVAQLRALLQDVLARAEAQRPRITTRPIPWTPPGSPGDENFPPALYVGAPGEYAMGGADPTPLLSLAEPAARAMLARRLDKIPAYTGTRLNERVRASILVVGAQNVWVNGKPLEGIAILDTGAMPLLIGSAGPGADGVDRQGCGP